MRALVREHGLAAVIRRALARLDVAAVEWLDMPEPAEPEPTVPWAVQVGLAAADRRDEFVAHLRRQSDELLRQSHAIDLELAELYGECN